MEFSFKQHSIIFTVGPSNCGKSTFAQQLDNKLNNLGYKSIILSSDTTRRTLLGNDDIHKHNKSMLRVSKQAFNILHNNLDNLTQYPVNYDFIIVDATNTNELSRKPLVDIAKRNGYNIVPVIFDFSNKSDYYKYYEDNSNFDADYVNSAINEFRISLKTIDLRGYEIVHRIRNNEFTDFNVSIIESPKEHYISSYENVLVIGDIHGCIDALKKLIIKSGMFTIDEEGIISLSDVLKYPKARIILVGDYLDKNTDEKIIETIEFIYKNRKFFLIVRGNHEKHCYDVLKGDIQRYSKVKETVIDEFGVSSTITKEVEIENEKEIIANYFSSVLLFDVNDDIRRKFEVLYEGSYYYIKDEKDRFIITHAPCSNNVLYKDNKTAYKSQNTIRYPKMNNEDITTSLSEREEFFKFIKEDANECMSYHIFGHVSVNGIMRYKNKINLDTGCYISGNLSGCIFSETNKKPFFISVNSDEGNNSKELYPMFRNNDVEKSIVSYDRDTIKFLRFCADNKVSFISGTMSPTNKEETKLESLQAGLDYYKSLGVEEVMLQVKKMGSRCNVYLYKDNPNKTVLVSRNGYVIRPKTLGISDDEFLSFKTSILDKYNYLFDELNADFILLDGELLPWKAMSNGLIEKDFIAPYEFKTKEESYLEKSGFYSMYENLMNAKELNEFHKKSQKKAIEFKEAVSTLKNNEYEIEMYKKQVDWFSKDYPLEFSPFMILKYSLKGVETICITDNKFSNLTVYNNLLKNDTWATVNLKTNESVICYQGEIMENETIESFYNHLSYRNNEEGAVLKPAGIAYLPGVAPYLKCRNRNYLRMTYGYDYLRTSKYNELIKTKDIHNKLRTSIKEWEIIRELLEINQNDISKENNKYITLMAKLHNVVLTEKELDPRL